MTHQTMPHILIVDDDISICKTLSAILQSERTQITTATTAKKAIEKTKTEFFDIVLLDVKLPDMEGTQLLEKLQEITPQTIKIMITGYPSIQNAVQALNLGADSYIMKPISPAKLTETIRNKLEAKQQAEKITKEKLAEWVQSEVHKKRSSNFQAFLQDTASELTDFGLTTSQAKTYITITALGIASASEIAALSKIRREQIYRTVPQLEEHGIVTRKLKKPQKFSAVPPERAIQLLIKTKLKTMKQEIDKLKQKQVKLISKLKTIELPVHIDNPTTEVFPDKDPVEKFIEIMGKAEQKIDVILQFKNLQYTYLNYYKDLKEEIPKKIKIRIITENHKPDAFTKEIVQFLETGNNEIQLKQVEELSFDLIIVDDKKAIWGEFQPKNGNTHNLRTNDPIQISILKNSFEYLWQKRQTRENSKIRRSTPLK